MNPTIGQALLVAAPALPIALAALCLFARFRARMSVLLVLAPVPALAAALIATGGPSVTFWRGLAPITLALDLRGAMLLGVCALLWIVAAAHALVNDRDRPASGWLAVCWLLTLTGSIGVFITADLAGFFLAYGLVSIPAYGLIVYDDAPSTRRAGASYMAFAILGETLLLMGFALLAVATPNGSLSIHDALVALPASPWRAATVALLIAGFGMKIGLVPVHVWMPLTYRAAPIPAAAVLSGAGVKAGVIGLIRFLPLGTALPGAGEALAAVGLLGAFYGVAIGLTQRNPKTVLAYSSVSQMGLVAAVLGMGLAAGDARAGTATAFYAANHVLVKGALFLAVGLVAATDSRRLWTVLLPAAVLAIGLGGLPLTGGAVAKFAIKGTLGYGIVAELSNLSAAASTLLMLHFMRCLMAHAGTSRREIAPTLAVAPWLVLAAASVAIPWALYPLATGGARMEVLAPAALWASLWPVLLGAFLAAVLYRVGPRVPRVPAGDILSAGSGAALATMRWSEVVERVESELRQWPIASLSLLATVLLLGAAMLIAR